MNDRPPHVEQMRNLILAALARWEKHADNLTNVVYGWEEVSDAEVDKRVDLALNAACAMYDLLSDIVGLPGTMRPTANA